MTDPYSVLGVEPDADDETIRRRYLELVRQFTPEQHPERFAAVRAAYERLKDLDARVRHRLFESGKRDGIEELIEDVACRTPRRRFGLQALLSMQRPAGR
jgi:curved DNA-binding protein CbpA